MSTFTEMDINIRCTLVTDIDIRWTMETYVAFSRSRMWTSN